MKNTSIQAFQSNTVGSSIPWENVNLATLVIKVLLPSQLMHVLLVKLIRFSKSL